VTQQHKLEIVTLSQEEADSFKERIINSSLAPQDQKIILALLSFNFWLQSQLSRAKLSILRLKKIFGLPTEKRRPKKDDPLKDVQNNSNDSAEPSTESPDHNESMAMVVAPSPQPTDKRKPVFDPDQNHGRYAASDYTGCPRVPILHATLKKGDSCPHCAEASLTGRLYELLPKSVVLLQGTPIITGTRYECDAFRCGLCGDQFIAEMPAEIATQEKYNETSISAIAISRYYAGIPFKRLEILQAIQGVPLADATQWDQMRKLYPVILPVHLALEGCAANGSLSYYDDTGNRILEAYGTKKAVHTTAFLSTYGIHQIYLFYTSQRIAGENMEALMADRTSEEALITMTDASSHNIPKRVNDDLLARWVLCFCLVHGRRKFYEMLDFFTPECEFVLNIIGQVYKHEAHCKKEKLDPEKRLEYHKKNSAPLMDALRVWLNNQFLHHRIEPNSGLGDATRYMLRHWDALTKFLTVAGAPIDNSVCEQTIKVAIRHRRNSLFYKTFKSAQVGDCIMSVIHTAAKNKVNIFDYLNELQRNQQAVQENPTLWLPWNYQNTLERMVERVELFVA
jgi:hypothetical protein